MSKKKTTHLLSFDLQRDSTVYYSGIYNGKDDTVSISSSPPVWMGGRGKRKTLTGKVHWPGMHTPVDILTFIPHGPYIEWMGGARWEWKPTNWERICVHHFCSTKGTIFVYPIIHRELLF